MLSKKLSLAITLPILSLAFFFSIVFVEHNSAQIESLLTSADSTQTAQISIMQCPPGSTATGCPGTTTVTPVTYTNVSMTTCPTGGFVIRGNTKVTVNLSVDTIAQKPNDCRFVSGANQTLVYTGVTSGPLTQGGILAINNNLVSPVSVNIGSGAVTYYRRGTVTFTANNNTYPSQLTKLNFKVAPTLVAGKMAVVVGWTDTYFNVKTPVTGYYVTAYKYLAGQTINRDASSALKVLDAVAKTGATSTTIYLPAYTPYTLLIRSRNSFGYGPDSLPLNIVSSVIDTPVTNVTLTPLTSTTAKVCWIAPYSASGLPSLVNSYSVKVNNRTITVAGNETCATVSVLPDSDNIVSITATNSAGSGPTDTITIPSLGTPIGGSTGSTSNLPFIEKLDLKSSLLAKKSCETVMATTTKKYTNNTNQTLTFNFKGSVDDTVFFNGVQPDSEKSSGGGCTGAHAVDYSQSLKPGKSITISWGDNYGVASWLSGEVRIGIINCPVGFVNNSGVCEKTTTNSIIDTTKTYLQNLGFPIDKEYQCSGTLVSQKFTNNTGLKTAVDFYRFTNAEYLVDGKTIPESGYYPSPYSKLPGYKRIALNPKQTFEIKRQKSGCVGEVMGGGVIYTSIANPEIKIAGSSFYLDPDNQARGLKIMAIIKGDIKVGDSVMANYKCGNFEENHPTFVKSDADDQFPLNENSSLLDIWGEDNSWGDNQAKPMHIVYKYVDIGDLNVKDPLSEVCELTVTKNTLDGIISSNKDVIGWNLWQEILDTDSVEVNSVGGGAVSMTVKLKKYFKQLTSGYEIGLKCDTEPKAYSNSIVGIDSNNNFEFVPVSNNNSLKPRLVCHTDNFIYRKIPLPGGGNMSSSIAASAKFFGVDMNSLPTVINIK
ncbi:MAG: fibronectin type III domain-containing protein [bacterium]